MTVCSYDEVPYRTFPANQTHPDRLAAVATLFGMTPAPVARCRVLEIGCGDGSNLIPMAYALPAGSFTGVDLAADAIATARGMAAALGLENLRLHAADLREIGAECGEFDYIIAHGLYSWIPPSTRDRLLAVCRERLAPQGVAFVSYNAYPGAHVRQALREMLLCSVRGLAGPAERIAGARRFLRSLLETNAAAATLTDEARAMLNRGNDGLYHDDLAEHNDPVLFRDFAAHARRHGLQYLGEADPHEMFDVSGALHGLGSGMLEREQCLDFLKMRRFRQTLLCREETALDRNPGPDRMDGFFFSAPARAVDGERIEGLRGVRIAADETTAQVTGALRDSYPLPLPFEELLPYADSRNGLREVLFTLVTTGFANLHVYDFPCEETVAATPVASRWAREQASRSRQVTSVCHLLVDLDDVTQRLVLLLDGTRGPDELARRLGAPVGERLEWLARMGLLEG